MALIEKHIQGKYLTFQTWLILVLRSLRCREGVARIRYVMNEHLLAYEGAVQIAVDSPYRYFMSGDQGTT